MPLSEKTNKSSKMTAWISSSVSYKSLYLHLLQCLAHAWHLVSVCWIDKEKLDTGIKWKGSYPNGLKIRDQVLARCMVL
jgi:hypothetical protein